MNALELKGVTKDFKSDFWKRSVRALTEVSFQVAEGDVFGLIGPNGAGKTTAIKILLGLIKPTRGSAEVFGHPTTEARFKRELGYLPENAYYYEYLYPEEVLNFYGRLFGMSAHERRRRTKELLELVGLTGARGVKLRNFSKGMLQRIGIAQALVNDPRLVVLDEPMSGLDPIGRKEVRDIILALAARGKTILFSSHILSDVEAICEKVAILVKGRLMASGTIRELVRAKVRSVEVTYHGSGGTDLPPQIREIAQVRSVGEYRVVAVSDPGRLEDILSWGRSEKLPLVSVVPHKESLEELFLLKVGEREGKGAA